MHLQAKNKPKNGTQKKRKTNPTQNMIALHENTMKYIVENLVYFVIIFGNIKICMFMYNTRIK